MAVFGWIAEFLYRMLVVPIDLLIGRRHKVYSATVSIAAPQNAVWDHMTALHISYGGVVPYEIEQRRRSDAPDLIDAVITIGDAKMHMAFRELESDGGSCIVAQVLKEGTDPSLYLGDDYLITSEMAADPIDGGTRLTVTYSVRHETLGGRFTLPLSVASTMQRIKTHIEKERGTAKAVPKGAPLRDAFVTGILTLGSFAVLFDLTFAAQLIVVLLLHELGHVIAMRGVGMPVKGVYFVPFMGAVAVGKSGFGDEARRGFIALMGPAASMLTTLVFLYLFVTTGDDLWRALTLVSIILNGFNLIPVLPLDGGQILSVLMSRAPFVAQRVVQLSLLSIAAVVALRFEAFVTLTFIGIVALVLAMQKPSVIRLRPINMQAGILLLLGYLATFAFYIGAGVWLVQLGRG